MIRKTIDVNHAGIDFEVIVKFTPYRPAPSIDPNNYDSTICDPGDPLEIEIEAVMVDGKQISCDFDEFFEACQDEIVEALD